MGMQPSPSGLQDSHRSQNAAIADIVLMSRPYSLHQILTLLKIEIVQPHVQWGWSPLIKYGLTIQFYLQVPLSEDIVSKTSAA